MNEPNTPTSQQAKYLEYMLSRAHERGVPHLPIETLSRKQVSDWIDYLKIVVGEEEPQGSSAYLITPPRDHLPSTYRPPWREMPDEDDHEHVLGTIQRIDGIEQSICCLCGVSA